MNPRLQSLPSRRIHVVTFAALMALLAATALFSRVHLGKFAVAIALLIAIAKMLLIIGYFMHVRHSAKITWIFVIAGFFWLGILLVLAMGDYLSRGW